jgi:16S rRNA (cytosine1402-N4)-methyltransferase
MNQLLKNLKMNNRFHKPVMLNECIDILNIKSNGIYIDATAGYGGHSAEISKKISRFGKLFCIDQDNDAYVYLEKKFINQKNVKVYNENFLNIRKIINEKVDGILLDLGVSSPMLDSNKRGFSYKNKSYLDMRMDQKIINNAYYVINKYNKEKLIEIFRKYGEIKNPKFVVNEICRIRKNKEILTTTDFAEIILKNDLHKNKMSQYFQAVRIEVNNELNVLSSALVILPTLLKKNGILAIVTFHSLEEKLVRQAFLSLSSSEIPTEIPIMKKTSSYTIINRKPITPTQSEIHENNRARSAKLFGIMKN